MEVKFERLLEPSKIGKLELRNRIVMPPMGTNFATADGSVTPHLVNYYAERAKGGTGLIIVEATAVDSRTGLSFNQICLTHHRYIPDLTRLVEAIHLWGAKCAIQLHHPGRQGNPLFTKELVAPSPIVCKLVGGEPRELKVEEIENLAEAYAESALRAKLAGFDAVEIHGAHGYLVCQFLSPYTNKRTDEWGKDFEGRMRFALEVVKRTKEKTGPDFPIIFRISGDEFVDGGLTLKETGKIAKCLEQSGVDAIHVSAGNYDSMLTKNSLIPPMYVPPGSLVHLAEGIKNAVGIPVIAVGGLTPEMAEGVLREGKADFIAFGRGLIADPYLPKKLVEGKPEEIRRCIRCNEGCIGGVLFFKPITCSLNALVGREEEWKIERAEKIKKVLIAGGGVAGMEAARVAALRGHEVVLYEKSDKLGGHLIEASAPQFKADIRNILEYLSKHVRKIGVKIETGKEVTIKMVEDAKPDVVVVATGSTPLIPKIPGIEKPTVVAAADVLLGKVGVGKKVVVAGGGLVGCETALFLAGEGREITIVEMLHEIAMDVEMISRVILFGELAEKSVKWLTNMKIEEITDEGIIALDKEQKKQTIEADTVVLALGLKSDNEFYKALEGKVPELYAIGDCVKPRKIIDSIREGFFVAREI